MFRFGLLPVIAASLMAFGAFAEEAPAPGSSASEPAAVVAAPLRGDASPAAAASGTPAAPVSAEPKPALATATATPPPAEPSSVIGRLPEALSPWGMFMQADLVVKAVMICLALASVATWTVLLVKTIQLRGARRGARRALATLLAARSLADAARQIEGQRSVVGALLGEAEAEVEKSHGLPADGIKERVAWQLERIEFAAGQRIGRAMGILATVGAVAPFVGLFGTVWGIMNSFIGISRAHTTNLAVVAPGIAEALLATAFGLVAAIPAVVIYNSFARSTGGYRAVLADASVAIMKLLSRDLDRAAAPIEVRRGLRSAEAPTLSIAESAE